jgi:hypothetical protein
MKHDSKCLSTIVENPKIKTVFRLIVLCLLFGCSSLEAQITVKLGAQQTKALEDEVRKGRKIQFHNQTGVAVAVLIFYYPPDALGGKFAGWFKLNGHETKNLVTNDRDVFFYYAKAISGREREWSGNHTVNGSNLKFNKVSTSGFAPEMEAVKLSEANGRRVQIEEKGNHTALKHRSG